MYVFALQESLSGEGGGLKRKEAIDEQKKRKGIDLLLVVSTFSSLAGELYVVSGRED